MYTKKIVLISTFGFSCCLMASMQQASQQLNHAVLPLMRLNADTVRPIVYPQLTQLIGELISKKQSITKKEFEAVNRAFTQACEKLGAPITEIYLANGRFQGTAADKIPLIDGNFKDFINENGKWTRLPDFLYYTKNLTDLHLSYNAFAPEEQFTALSTMHQLKHLTIIGNGMYSEPIRHLPDLSHTQLVYLDVVGDLLTLQQIVGALGNQTAFIQTLYLSGTKVTNQELSLLAQCTSLRTLALNSLELTALPKEFSRLTHLQSLLLVDNKLNQKGLEPITSLTNLMFLDLSQNDITELPRLDALKNLKILTLEKNPLSADARAYLEKLKMDVIHGLTVYITR